MPRPLQVAFPCGVKFEAPAGWLGETLENPAVKGPLCAAAGKDPKGPILDAIIALLPTILPIVLPLIIQSFAPKNGDNTPPDDDTPPCP